MQFFLERPSFRNIWGKNMAFHAASIFRFLKCSGKNVLYSSCHFPNHELVSVQILHHTKLSWNITPLGSFRSNVIYFVQKEQKKVEIVRILSDRSKFTKFVSFFKQQIIFSSSFTSILSVMIHKFSILF